MRSKNRECKYCRVRQYYKYIYYIKHIRYNIMIFNLRTAGKCAVEIKRDRFDNY